MLDRGESAILLSRANIKNKKINCNTASQASKMNKYFLLKLLLDD